MSDRDNRGDAPQEAKLPVEPAKPPPTPAGEAPKAAPVPMQKEVGGPAGPEPTRYGDWERKGRVSDF